MVVLKPQRLKPRVLVRVAIAPSKRLGIRLPHESSNRGSDQRYSAEATVEAIPGQQRGRLGGVGHTRFDPLLFRDKRQRVLNSSWSRPRTAGAPERLRPLCNGRNIGQAN